MNGISRGLTRARQRAVSATAEAAGFSLVELVCVLGIVGLLLALGIVVTNHVRRDAGRARARTDLEKIGFALQEYKLRHGAYPVLMSTNGGSFAEATRFAVEQPDVTNRLHAIRGATVGLIDPWGRSYRYVLSDGLCRIYSVGMDGLDGTEDDLEVRP